MLHSPSSSTNCYSLSSSVIRLPVILRPLCCAARIYRTDSTGARPAAQSPAAASIITNPLQTNAETLSQELNQSQLNQQQKINLQQRYIDALKTAL